MGSALFRGVVLAIALLVTGISLLSEGEHAVIYLAPVETAASSTAEKTYALVIETKKPINVVSGTLTYSTSSLSVNLVSQEGSFVDLWLTPPRNDATLGVIPFTGGTSSSTGLMNRGILFLVSVATTSSEYAKISIENVEAFGHDGQGTQLSVASRPLIVYDPALTDAVSGGVGGGPEGGNGLEARSDLNGDGKVTLADLSVLLVKTIEPFDETYDLNGDGKLGLGDFSALLTVLGALSSEKTPAP